MKEIGIVSYDVFWIFVYERPNDSSIQLFQVGGDGLCPALANICCAKHEIVPQVTWLHRIFVY